MKLTEEDSVKIVGFFHSLSFKFLTVSSFSWENGCMSSYPGTKRTLVLKVKGNKGGEHAQLSLGFCWWPCWDSGVSPWRRLGNPQTSE